MSLINEEKEKLREKYVDYVNKHLPHGLLPGIEKAMDLYKEIYEDEGLAEEEDNAVCLIIDGGRMAFAVGDGLDIDGPDDDAVFYKHDCKMLETCAQWVKDMGMDLTREQEQWLGDSITLAAEEGCFDWFNNFAVYGDTGYGAGEFDPFYESYDDEDDWDDENDDWDRENEE